MSIAVLFGTLDRFFPWKQLTETLAEDGWLLVLSLDFFLFFTVNLLSDSLGSLALEFSNFERALLLMGSWHSGAGGFSGYVILPDLIYQLCKS